MSSESIDSTAFLFSFSVSCSFQKNLYKIIYAILKPFNNNKSVFYILSIIDLKFKFFVGVPVRNSGELNSVIAVLQNGPVKIGAKTGTTNKIFGRVTSVQIARAIKEQKGYEIDRRRINIVDDVKELGNYKAKIDFGKGQEIDVDFEVVAE